MEDEPDSKFEVLLNILVGYVTRLWSGIIDMTVSSLLKYRSHSLEDSEDGVEDARKPEGTEE